MSTTTPLLLSDLTGDKTAVLRRFAEAIASDHGLDAEAVHQGLIEREQLGTTAIGSRIALPHCRLKKARSVHLAVGISKRGVEFDSPDGEPVTLFFVLVSPSNSNAVHLAALKTLSNWIQQEELQRLARKPTVDRLQQALESLELG